MLWLFRRFCTVIGFLVCLLVALYLARNLVVEHTLCWLIPHKTTFECTIDRVQVESSWPLRIHLTGLKIENPPDFSDRLALDIPTASLELPSHFWQNDTLIFNLVDLQIARFNLVNTEPGVNNLSRFNAVAQRNVEMASGFDFQVLQLRITDARYARNLRFSRIDSQKKLVDIFREISVNR